MSVSSSVNSFCCPVESDLTYFSYLSALVCTVQEVYFIQLCSYADSCTVFLEVLIFDL